MIKPDTHYKPIAFIWGLCEATFFFFVPDVWLSIAGRKHYKRGLIACAYAVVGALIGGSILYVFGGAYPDDMRVFLAHVPEINNILVAKVRLDIEQNGVLSILFAPLSGTPFKTYAGQAAEGGVGFWAFIAISTLARGLRFLVVMSSIHLLYRFAGRWLSDTLRLRLLLLGWAVFYVGYFSTYLEFTT